MFNNNLRFFAINLGISSFYLSLTCFEFVIVQSANPIGIGIQQFLLILIHVAIVSIYGIPPMSGEAQSGFVRIKRVMIDLFAIFISASVYFIFNSDIWKWLWRIRRQ